MISKAILKKALIAPRKARLVIDLIRGQKIPEAKAILTFTPKTASPIILKLLNSAEANITKNMNLNSNDFYIFEAYVNESERLKRLCPRAKGSSNMIKKRTIHITLVLSSEKHNYKDKQRRLV
nr:ribosomal protein L22 ['Periploca aphylla' witches'-broom phytoplasma]